MFRGLPWLKIAAGVVLAAILVGSGWLLWQHQQDNDQINELQSELTSAQNQVDAYQNQAAASPSPSPSPSLTPTPSPSATPRATAAPRALTTGTPAPTPAATPTPTRVP